MGLSEPEHLVNKPKPCPRPGCGSLNTKFRYYNNGKTYQPRYMCLKCTKYFTHGGTTRQSKKTAALPKPHAAAAAPKKKGLRMKVLKPSSSDTLPKSHAAAAAPKKKGLRTKVLKPSSSDMLPKVHAAAAAPKKKGLRTKVLKPSSSDAESASSSSRRKRKAEVFEEVDFDKEFNFVDLHMSRSTEWENVVRPLW